jgi:hypothetical protein
MSLYLQSIIFLVIPKEMNRMEKQILSLLRSLEYLPHPPFGERLCPVCYEDEHVGHGLDCLLHKVLQELNDDNDDYGEWMMFTEELRHGG